MMRSPFLCVSRRFQSSSSTNIRTLLKTPNKYNDKNSAFNFKPSYPEEGIFFNPAPSAPTPQKTPNVFLPPTDPRRNNPLYNTEPKIDLKYMPELESKQEKNYHMTKEQIAEMQKMRLDGATRKQMTEKFGVSNFFLSISTDPNPELVLKRSAKQDLKRAKWSKDKVVAKQSKAKRQQMWLRDEY